MNIQSTSYEYMGKKLLILIATIFVFGFVFSGVVLIADSNGDEVHGKPIEVVLQEIREHQGLGPDELIDPRKVSKKDLEELGEAVMSIMHPDPEEHRLMDDMMGGEGSARLARMHRRIALNYFNGDRDNMYGMFRESSGMGNREDMHGTSRGNRGENGGMTGRGMMGGNMM
jgi:hypothetical protein